jgi:bla regulator protein blaR1
MTAALINHLWQSTLFVVAAGVLAMALRANGAHVRHRIWLAASLKFLVPFSVLLSLGGALPWLMPAAPAPATSAAPALSVTVDRIAQPFPSDGFPTAAPTVAAPAGASWLPLVLAGLWAGGFLVVVGLRLREWRRVRAAVEHSAPVAVDAPIPVRSSPGLLEPGIVGLWRPVLLVPAGIEAHLTSSQMTAILAHELCHVARRDNLTSAIHMVVEAVFWFHPLVWWVGGRLVEERERACDEHVLRVCGEPTAYAESILTVCKLYVESPLACVSGVTGSGLKKRIAAIMGNHIGRQLSPARCVTLAIAAVLAVALPLAAGVLTAPLRASAVAAIDSVVDQGQSAGARFDVVSVKPCPQNQPFTNRSAPAPAGFRRGGAPYQAYVSPGYVYWDCVTLSQLVDQAYADQDHPLLNIVAHPRQNPVLSQPKRVRGGPSWAETDKFTIEAKAPVELTRLGPAGSAGRYLAALPAPLSAALRAVLEDRFKAKVHRATEQQDMYALTVGKDGLNNKTLVRPTPGDCLTVAEYSAAAAAGRISRDHDPALCGRVFSSMDRGLEFSSYPLKRLAAFLSDSVDRYVIDRTGIDTPFNFTIKADPGPAGDDMRFSRALADLGLKLEAIKGPAEHLVIDHAEPPTPDAPLPAPPARAAGAGPR